MCVCVSMCVYVNESSQTYKSSCGVGHLHCLAVVHSVGTQT